MFKAIGGFFREQKAAKERRIKQIIRDEKLKKIRAFQEDYRAGGDLVKLMITYECLSEDELAAASDEELDALVKKCDDGFPSVAAAKDELEYKAEADNPETVYTENWIAPRRSMWLEYSKKGKQLAPNERQCIALLRILCYYRFIDDDERASACIPFLCPPTFKTADPDYDKRTHLEGNESLDLPVLKMVMREQIPRSWGFDKTQKHLDRAMEKYPDNNRLKRLKREFIERGVPLS